MVRGLQNCKTWKSWKWDLKVQFLLSFHVVSNKCYIVYHKKNSAYHNGPSHGEIYVLNHLVFGPPFTFLKCYLQSKEILLNLNMKCWSSTFNAQGLKVIIIVVQIGAMKIYVTTMEVLMQKGK